MPAGQPTKYNEDMLQKAKEYIAGGYKAVEDQIPTVIGLRKYLGIARSTAYKWADDHPEFSDTLSELMDFQQVALLNGGLSGDMNPTITKLVLSANHGMHERQETEHSGRVGVFEINYEGANYGDTPGEYDLDD